LSRKIGCLKEIKKHEYRVGVEEACRRSNAIKRGMNLYKGKCVYENVSKAFNMPYTLIDEQID
jgi:alanine dehydrogenase